MRKFSWKRKKTIIIDPLNFSLFCFFQIWKSRQRHQGIQGNNYLYDGILVYNCFYNMEHIFLLLFLFLVILPEFSLFIQCIFLFVFSTHYKKYCRSLLTGIWRRSVAVFWWPCSRIWISTDRRSTSLPGTHCFRLCLFAAVWSTSVFSSLLSFFFSFFFFLSSSFFSSLFFVLCLLTKSINF